MKKHSLLFLPSLVALLVQGTALSAHEPITRARTPVTIPDIPGLVTMKCDLHIHTVFSDGLVWPSVRAEEAWREGLDAIAITDHIEYQPHRKDVSTNHNRSFVIANDAGRELDLIVIHGSEITREMPPGHLNAIYLTNSSLLVAKEWRDAVAAASAQNAFIFWNHPGWERQLKDGKTVWYPEHTELLEKGMLHGIEVVNGREYFPEAHRWAVEKKLTMLSNSDIHPPLNLSYHVHDGDHRPMTFVLAKERTAAAMREALFDRRTVVYSGDRLIGEERFLRPIFERSLHILPPRIPLKGKGKIYAQITNQSDIDYQLVRVANSDEVSLPGDLVLAAHKTVLLEIRGRDTQAEGRRKVQSQWKVTNLLVGPDEPLSASLSVDIEFGSK